MRNSMPILDRAMELVADFACDIGENPIWHPLERKLYWCDIPKGRIFRFDSEDGLPDGMTRDNNGDIWCAFWDGGCVVQISADGIQRGQILVPTPKASSVAFGGPDYQDLYITTAGGNIRESDGELAGSLFSVRCGASGVPEFLSRIGVSQD
jgi:sugar lactone lactonase YvrE